MEKINIAELLKDCPQGMELACTMYDNIELNYVLEGNAYPIKVQTPDGQISLNKYGCYSNNEHAKCVIFPKGKTTWEGFVPPCKFKEGDIISNDINIAIANIPAIIAIPQYIGINMYFIHSREGEYSSCCFEFAFTIASANFS